MGSGSRGALALVRGARAVALLDGPRLRDARRHQAHRLAGAAPPRGACAGRAARGAHHQRIAGRGHRDHPGSARLNLRSHPCLCVSFRDGQQFSRSRDAPSLFFLHCLMGTPVRHRRPSGIRLPARAARGHHLGLRGLAARLAPLVSDDDTPVAGGVRDRVRSRQVQSGHRDRGNEGLALRAARPRRLEPSHTRGCRWRCLSPAGRRLEATYTVIPTRRGEVKFAPADVRVRSRWGLCELLERLGTERDAPRLSRLRPGGALRMAGGRSPPAGNRHQDVPAARERGRTSSSCPIPRRRFAAPHGLASDAETERSRSSASFRTSAISASCCSSTAAGGCAQTIGRARSAPRTSTRY